MYSENLIKRTVDAIVRDGYKDAGYEYVIIDDCWSEMERSSEGLLVPDKLRFPSGMKALSDYVSVAFHFDFLCGHIFQFQCGCRFTQMD